MFFKTPPSQWQQAYVESARNFDTAIIEDIRAGMAVQKKSAQTASSRKSKYQKIASLKEIDIQALIQPGKAVGLDVPDKVATDKEVVEVTVVQYMLTEGILMKNAGILYM